MKNLIKLTICAALVSISFSCKDDFLNREPSQFLTTDQIADAALLDPGILAGSMNGTYVLTINSGTGGTGGHDDFGQKAYDIFGDFLSGDMSLSVSTYGWYRTSITEFQACQDFTFTDNYQVWRYYYRIIRSANLVIDGLGGNDAVPVRDENKYLMGQAKAIRAHSYFYLTQYFANSYNASAEILPLYTKLSDLNGPKVATSEIYALMEKDLTDAIGLLTGFTRANTNMINRPIAKGIMAYVLASRGDYAGAYTMASEAANEAGGTPVTGADITGGFNNVNTTGWMWGFDLNSDTGLGLVSWWGQIDRFSYSYAWAGDAKAMDQSLYDAIPANDARKAQFTNNPGAYNHLMPNWKFYDPARRIGGTATITHSDYVYMRVAEMMLLAAESAAFSGNEAAAKTMLKSLLTSRLPDVTYVDALSGQALKDEIYLQTRIELWGEGKSYLAMKRNKATVTRGTNHLSFVGVPVAHDDERMTFEIPEAEIQNNPFISGQN